MKMDELPEEERIEQGDGVPLMAAEPSLVLSDGEDGGVPLTPAAVVRKDDHDDDDNDDDNDNDDNDDFDPDDLDQLPEADDENADWEEDEEEEAAPTEATKADSGDVLDQYAPDSLPPLDPNRVDSFHLSSNENCF
jgi:hypothetical protein